MGHLIVLIPDKNLLCASSGLFFTARKGLLSPWPDYDKDAAGYLGCLWVTLRTIDIVCSMANAHVSFR